MNTIWVVEAKLTYQSPPRWKPIANSVHYTRKLAREAARHLFATNQYNNFDAGEVFVRYRATKYISVNNVDVELVRIADMAQEVYENT